MAPLVATAVLAALLGSTPGPVAELAIPHRSAPIAVDGDLEDWGEHGVVLELRDPASRPDPSRARIALAWDRHWLYAAFQVADARVVPPPEGVRPAELYQGDSVELYLDGGGERSERMDGNDFQFIVSCDGRWGTLQGEPVLARLKTLAVPKIERPSPLVRAAARTTPSGYVVELAVPLPGLLTRPPADGVRAALDLAVNDWDAGHPALDDPTMDDLIDGAARALRGERGGRDEGDGSLARALQLGYSPWSLCSERDFGYPARWRPVVFRGNPPWPERVADRLGVGRLLVIAMVGSTGLWLALLAGIEIRHRRRVRALLERLGQLEGSEGDTVAAPEHTPRHIRVALADTGATRLDAVTVRALSVLRERIGEPLSPAELAAAIFVSLRTLQRSLERELHCTPRELIVGVKMHTARRLLASGTVRVSEVAGRVGFEDPAHFSRRYRAYFGHPPSHDVPGRGGP